MSRFTKRLRSQTGAALVEYALVASLIALPSVAAMNAISANMNEEFNAIEDNAASAGHGTTTTEGATTTTAGGEGIPTTTTTTTTTTTAAPATTTTTTTTTTAAPGTTTTAAPGTTTTTTTAAPATTTTAAPQAAPAYQEEYVETPAGWFVIAVNDGDIYIDDYSLGYRWTGTQQTDDDGNLVIDLDKRRSYREVHIFAWLDDDGYLHVDVNQNW
jgi:Flp pilus assembly pilin Flp